jgi:hypothetical protein
MPWITEQQAIDLEVAEEKVARLTSQLDALVEALDDVLLVFHSGAKDQVKLMRIEDLLASGVADAAQLEPVGIR